MSKDHLPADYERPAPAEALLLLDAGNTRLGVGVWQSGVLHSVQRRSNGDADGWRQAIADAWSHVQPARTRAVVLASVRPQSSVLLDELVADVCDQSILRVRDDLPLPMMVDVDEPDRVGVDRVCSAAAAYERLSEPCAVASFGTAITIDCVSPEGRFLGGTILPGLELSLSALHEGAALLPEVSLRAPSSAVGKNTQDAMRAGVVFGAVGALREIVECFANELGRWPTLVATGGDADLLRPLANFIDHVVPDLSLMGIALAHRRAAGVV